MPDSTEWTKILLPKSAVYYLCHLKSNNIIDQRKTTNKEKHFYPWLTSFNLKLSCTLQIASIYLYIYCTNWLIVISCQEQIKRLLVVIHHENIHELASLRFLNLNLEQHNIKMGRKTYEDLFFSFMKLCSKSPSCNRIPQLFLQLQFFLIAAAMIIATYGQKALHWQLSKVTLPDFEAIN